MSNDIKSFKEIQRDHMDRYYCGGSGASRTEFMLVSKTSREWCGVKNWVQVTTDDTLFIRRGEWREDRDRTKVSWLRGLGIVGDRCN